MRWAMAKGTCDRAGGAEAYSTYDRARDNHGRNYHANTSSPGDGAAGLEGVLAGPVSALGTSSAKWSVTQRRHQQFYDWIGRCCGINLTCLV